MHTETLPAELNATSPQGASAPDQTPLLAVRPVAELLEGEQEFRLVLEMPGVHVDDLSVTLERQELTVTGMAPRPELPGFRQLTGLRGGRRFERTFQLSDGIDRDGIQAEIKQGLVTITLPKSQKARKSVVPVKAG